MVAMMPHNGCFPIAGTLAAIELKGQKSSSTHARMSARVVMK